MSQAAHSQASSDALAAELEQMKMNEAHAAAADADEERTLSLPAHFYRCQTLYTQMFVSSKLPRTLSACQSLQRSLESLQRRIEAASLFSSNESGADDLSTASIKFLLAPYYLAQLHTSFPCQIAQRSQHVQAAANAFAAFMRRLESYGLVHEEGEADTFKRLNTELLRKLTAPTSASSSSSSRPPMPGSSAWIGPGGKRLDPSAVRTAKIARVRRDKELGAQLEVLQQSRTASYRQRKQSANTITSANAQADEEADDELLDSGSDESDVRAFYLLLLQRLVLSTVDATRSALDEADMICHYRDVELRKPKHEQLEHMSAEDRARLGAGPGGAPGPKPVMYKMTPESLSQPVPEHMKHLMQNVAQPAQNGGRAGAASSSSSSLAAAFAPPAVSSVATSVDDLIAARASSRQSVFALTNQPTYSIEQWADMEIAAGRMPGPADASAAPRQPDPRRIRSAADREVAEEMVAAYQATQEESDELGHEDGAAGMAKDELKTLKDREWDNWKDDHQRGVGNSIK